MPGRALLHLILAAALLGGASPASGQAASCLDPAMPLRELAHEFDWRPSERAARRAFPALQAYLTSGTPRANRAAALAYRAVLSQDPRDAHAQDALALLYAMGPDLNYPEGESYRFNEISGHSLAAVAGARMLLERVAADSTRWLHAVALTRIALASPDRSRLAYAIQAVRRARTADPDHVALRLALRDLYVLAGRYSDARQAAADIRGACAPVQHAHAEALILDADSATGVRLYLAALQNARPAELHRFEDDISTIVTRTQRAAYRSTPPEQRNAWLRSFWEHNAAASGRTVETRIVDQLRRAAWANANDRGPRMQPSSDHAISWMTDTVHRTPWGARGILYTRHGPPHRLYRASFGGAEYEGWIYFVADRPWTFVFTRGGDDTNRAAGSGSQPDDSGLTYMGDESPMEPLTGVAAEHPGRRWRLQTAPSCLNAISFLGRFRPERMLQRLAADEPLDVRELFVALSPYEPRYEDLARSCTSQAAAPRGRQRTWLRQWAREMETGYADILWQSSAVPPFVTQLRVTVAAYQFRDANHDPELVALLWVPAADLTQGAAGATRTLRVTFSVVDSVVGSTRRDLTLAVPTTRQDGVLSASTVWRGADVRSGTLRAVAVDPADTTRAGSAAARVPAVNHADTLFMSDLVLAGTDQAGSLMRGSYSVSPLPNHALEQDHPVRVFFELYGLEAAQPIRTTIAITPDRPRSIRETLGLGGDRERRFTYTTAADLDQRGIAVQDFDLGGEIEPGPYIVDVTVQIGDRSLKRRTTLKVLSGAP